MVGLSHDPAFIDGLIERITKGESVNSVVRSTGVHRDTIVKHMLRRGITPPSKRTTADIVSSLIEKRRPAPQTQPQIAARPPTGAVVLAIPDLHCPFEHPDSLEFLKAVRDNYKPDQVVCLRNKADFCAFSRFPRDPDGLSPGAELQAAIDHLFLFYKEFPTVKGGAAGHTVRPLKQAFLAG